MNTEALLALKKHLEATIEFNALQVEIVIHPPVISHKDMLQLVEAGLNSVSDKQAEAAQLIRAAMEDAMYNNIRIPWSVSHIDRVAVDTALKVLALSTRPEAP